MIVKIELYRDDGKVIIQNIHRIHSPGKDGWAIHPATGPIVDGIYGYSGYTIEFHGRELVWDGVEGK